MLIKTMDIENTEDILDYSGLIIEGIKKYLHNFQYEIIHYVDAYGIFLREVKEPFRCISIFHHIEKGTYELISELIDDYEKNTVIYRKTDIRTLESCIKKICNVILGFDRMSNLMQDIEHLKKIKI